MSKEVKLQISPVSKGKAKSRKASKNSKSPYDNPICSECQASGRMIAVQCFRLADGITMVVERQGFSHLSDINSIDLMKIEAIPAFMNFFVVPKKTLNKIENATETI